MPSLSTHSPLGPLTIFEDDGVLTALEWRWSAPSDPTGLLVLAHDQLRDYFDGKRREFSLPFAPKGTEFQRRVWSLMREIPFGEVRSYGDLARRLRSGALAIGMACGRNPLPVFIPCHRVVGADGSLTGYSGGDGLVTKDFLLDLERNGPRLL